MGDGYFSKLLSWGGVFDKWKWAVKFSKICKWGRPPTIQCERVLERFSVPIQWSENYKQLSSMSANRDLSGKNESRKRCL